MADFDLDAILGTMKAEMSSVGAQDVGTDFKVWLQFPSFFSRHYFFSPNSSQFLQFPFNLIPC